MTGGPACAHSRVLRGTVPSGHSDGSVCDRWACNDCDTVFCPAFQLEQLAAERDALRALLTVLLDAWGDSWDCSRSPGHDKMHEATERVCQALDLVRKGGGG